MNEHLYKLLTQGKHIYVWTASHALQSSIHYNHWKLYQYRANKQQGTDEARSKEDEHRFQAADKTVQVLLYIYIYIYTDIQVSDCAGYLCNKLGVQFGAIQTTTCEWETANVKINNNKYSVLHSQQNSNSS